MFERAFIKVFLHNQLGDTPHLTVSYTTIMTQKREVFLQAGNKNIFLDARASLDFRQAHFPIKFYNSKMTAL